MKKATMKEEAPNKNLPPKMSGGSGSGCGSLSNTSTKSATDEILSSLLRINNFDSISSIKDESLDIDLSACVTITADSAMMINGNSLSTIDFWRVLDESAQNSQLELTLSGDDGTNLRCDALMDLRSSTPETKSNSSCDFNKEEVLKIKKEIMPSNFSGTFLRPETPPPGSLTFSPLKKIIKPATLQTKKAVRKQSTQQRKTKLPTNGNNNNTIGMPEGKKSKAMHVIKEEPQEQLLLDALDNAATSPIAHSHTENGGNSKMNASPPKFKIFMLSGAASGSNNNNNAINGTVSSNSNNNNNHLTKNKHAKTDNFGSTTTTTTININTSNEAIPTATNMKDIVTPIEKLYKCIDCSGLLLKGEAERSTHEIAGHRVLFRCTICIKDFEQETGLKKHLKTHRAVETRKDVWKKCPDCGKCLKLGSMWMHRKIHSENRKYGCDICGQKFVQKINLTHHSRVHTAEKPYECPECQKRFQERSHLYRHQKYHAQTRSYRCEKCGKMYKTERCLKVHNLVHLEQRPFACTVCDKSFISNSKLKQHSNIHTGERPFKCNYCPRDFTNFPNWLKHTRRRHKVDHKTGEQLENIPSYCSKKSKKPVPPKKTAACIGTTPPTTLTTPMTVANKSNAEKKAAILTTTASACKPITSAPTTGAAGSEGKPPTITTTIDLTSAQTTTTTRVAVPPPPPPTTTAVCKATVKRQKKKTNAELAQLANKKNNNLQTDSLDVKVQQFDMKANANLPQVVHEVQATALKAPKIKRERKQAQPKQVQKVMQPPLPAIGTTTMAGQFALPNKVSLASTSPVSVIKREIVESSRPLSQCSDSSLEKSSTSIMNSFNDLHCLSITSAEELIMEQALEMEESGLFNARRTSAVSAGMADTDNATSATETATALHFKVKHEIDSDVDALGIKQEEFVSLNYCHKRALCCSLESSPYSSPASIELCSANATTTSTASDMCAAKNNNNNNSNQNDMGANSPIYFMPSNFQLHQSALPTNVTLMSNNNDKLQTQQDTNVTLLTTEQEQQQQHHHHQHEQQQQQMYTLPTQVLINQLYMPTLNGSSMLLPLSNNQMLPSVDTLLFSAAAAAAAASRASATVTVNTHTTSTSSRYHRPKGVTPQSRT